MAAQRFSSDKELIAFAEKFLRRQTSKFRKDINICLTGRRRRGATGLTHAYFPALITCIGFADLLSGLYAGDLQKHGLKELHGYASKFMDAKKYDLLQLTILYEAFRHKVAHLNHPYMVFDTQTKPRAFLGQPRRRITWIVYASRRSVPIELIKLSSAQNLDKSQAPWPVTYDHIVKISVRSIATDILRSLKGQNGYLAYLKSDKAARSNFEKCMNDFYPT